MPQCRDIFTQKKNSKVYNPIYGWKALLIVFPTVYKVKLMTHVEWRKTCCKWAHCFLHGKKTGDIKIITYKMYASMSWHFNPDKRSKENNPIYGWKALLIIFPTVYKVKLMTRLFCMKKIPQMSALFFAWEKINKYFVNSVGNFYRSPIPAHFNLRV